MSGYCNLATSPPAVATAGAAEESKWEGVAVGTATLARNFSSASQRFRPAVERSKSKSNGGGGLPAVVRRAFSMRSQPSSSFADGYWRIHDDMDGEHQEKFEEGEQKRGEEEQDHATSGKEEVTKKKGRRIFKACKKLLGF